MNNGGHPPAAGEMTVPRKRIRSLVPVLANAKPLEAKALFCCLSISSRFRISLRMLAVLVIRGCYWHWLRRQRVAERVG